MPPHTAPPWRETVERVLLDLDEPEPVVLPVLRKPDGSLAFENMLPGTPLGSAELGETKG